MKLNIENIKNCLYIHVIVSFSHHKYKKVLI